MSTSSHYIMPIQPPSSDKIFSVPSLLALQAERIPDSLALLAPGRKPLSYRALYDHVSHTVSRLNQLGIGRGNRVMIVIPDGPELTTAQLAIGSGTSLIAVSETLTADDYDYLLTKSLACALLIQKGLESPARTVAQKLNLRVIEVVPDFSAEAGVFTLEDTTQPPELEQGLSAPIFAQPDDVLQIVPTSGTTGRPKLVPRTQRGWCVSRNAWNELRQYTEDDIFLNTQPLTYTAGFNFLLAMLWIGGKNVCTPGFDTVQFYNWLDEFRPTYFFGSANNLQAILNLASLHQDTLSRLSLKAMFTGFMPMPQQLERSLEAVFNVPIIMTYGSTETLGVTMNRLDRDLRKSGSVGIPFDIDVAIFDQEGNPLPAKETGEIVLRGARVFTGYEGDPEATNQAFINGWFRIGDLGYLDEDGYLYLTGRVKEIINRAGYKVSPGEVEEALLAHPEVAEAVAFGMPDRSLGEEIAAAVVLRKPLTEAVQVTEKDLQHYVMPRLTEAKVPRRIIFLDELPRTNVGKIQRIGMASRLGLTLPPPASAPITQERTATELEQQITNIWAFVLKRPVETIGIQTPFRDLGGDSLGATRLVFAIRQQLNVLVTILDLFDASTVEQQAVVIEKLRLHTPAENRLTTLIPIRAEGSRPPIFCFHAVKGGVYYYHNLLDYLPDDQPLYGLQAVGMDGLEPPLKRIEDMVDHHLKQIRSVQMSGPYFLVGFSLGGQLALETARRLRDEFGAEAFVFIIDDQWGKFESDQSSKNATGAKRLWLILNNIWFALTNLPLRYKWYFVERTVQQIAQRLNRTAASVANNPDDEDATDDKSISALPAEIKALIHANKGAIAMHVIRRYDGPVTFVRSIGINLARFRAFKEVNGGKFEFIDLPIPHGKLMRIPTVSHVGKHLRVWLDRVQNNTK